MASALPEEIRAPFTRAAAPRLRVASPFEAWTSSPVAGPSRTRCGRVRPPGRDLAARVRTRRLRRPRERTLVAQSPAPSATSGSGCECCRVRRPSTWVPVEPLAFEPPVLDEELFAILIHRRRARGQTGRFQPARFDTRIRPRWTPRRRSGWRTARQIASNLPCSGALAHEVAVSPDGRPSSSSTVSRIGSTRQRSIASTNGAGAPRAAAPRLRLVEPLHARVHLVVWAESLGRAG